MTLRQIETECTRLSAQLVRLNRQFMGPRECSMERDILRELDRLDELGAALRAGKVAA